MHWQRIAIRTHNPLRIVEQLCLYQSVNHRKALLESFKHLFAFGPNYSSNSGGHSEFPTHIALPSCDIQSGIPSISPISVSNCVLLCMEADAIFVRREGSTLLVSKKAPGAFSSETTTRASR